MTFLSYFGGEYLEISHVIESLLVQILVVTSWQSWLGAHREQCTGFWKGKKRKINWGPVDHESSLISNGCSGEMTLNLAVQSRSNIIGHYIKSFVLPQKL